MGLAFFCDKVVLSVQMPRVHYNYPGINQLLNNLMRLREKLKCT